MELNGAKNCEINKLEKKGKFISRQNDSEEK